MQTFLFLLELAGTVAFAVSGAVLGIEKHMDIFGVGLLGITTAVGGGILRDLVVGLTPPRAFQDPMYLLVALGVSVVLFFPFVRRLIGRSKRVFDALMLLMDATGLGIFTITGINTAITLADCTDPLLLVFVGLLTGLCLLPVDVRAVLLHEPVQLLVGNAGDLVLHIFAFHGGNSFQVV